MGSVDQAVIPGYVCRLCSKVSRQVIPFYGNLGRRLRLAEMVNFLLPIEVTPDDQFPKCMCMVCCLLLLRQHSSIRGIRLNNARLLQNCKKPANAVTPTLYR